MKVNIRSAKSKDTQAICDLLKQMGYPQPFALIQEKFEILHNDANSQILIAEERGKIYGFYLSTLFRKLPYKVTLPKYAICVLMRICVAKV